MKSEDGNPFCKELRDVFNTLSEGKINITSAQKLRNSLPSRYDETFKIPGQQHGVHEFLGVLIQEFARNSEANQKAIESVMELVMDETVACVKCNDISRTKEDKCLDLQLHLTRQRQTLQGMIDNVLKSEEYVDVECERCDTRVSKIRKLNVSTTPKILTLMFKRYVRVRSVILNRE